jgi:hypothetical protein
MVRNRDEIIEERRRLKAQYNHLFDDVAALLFRHDPIGIAFDNENVDEHELEARTILPKLRECQSAKDTLQVVHQEFVRWFGAEIAGAEKHYTLIATEIWHLWEVSPAGNESSMSDKACGC